MRVLFASDVHLSALRPRQADAFVRFLAGPCRRAERLYLLGDVFDAWLGDDDARDPHPRIERALAELAASGVAVGFAHGNHDFLVGEDFARRTGCTLLAQPCVVRVGALPVVVLHGDELCTRDQDYQRWRRHFTDRDNQRRFLALPFETRVEQAAALRLASAERTTLKPEDIMDVSDDAVRATLAAHRARHMVHGHTHRPAVHALELGGERAQRMVLGDWYAGDRVLVWDDAGPRLASAASL